MKTVIEVLQLTTAHLEDVGRLPARRMAEEAISSALGMARLDLYLQFDKPLNEEELARCREVVARAQQGEPMAYIIGQIEFYGCQLRVNRDVLIPRPETELLVDRIATELAKESLEGKQLWDIGCGSGCIGIALKKRFPELQVVLTDICPKAVRLAAQNGADNGIEVDCREGDLCAPLQGCQADFIVSNPPYVTAAEWEGLDASVRQFEPQKALVAGPTGLEYYHRLQREIPASLRPGGKLYLEIGHRQGEALIEMFSSTPWHSPQYDVDWAGHDRFFVTQVCS